MKPTIKYFHDGQYHYATVKDIGDIEKLKTLVRTDLVSAINSIADGTVGGADFDSLVDQINGLNQQIEDILLNGVIKTELDKAIAESLIRINEELQGAIASVKGEYELRFGEITREYDAKVAAVKEDVVAAKENLASVEQSLIATGERLTNIDLNYTNVQTEIDTINGKFANTINSTQFNLLETTVQENTTAVEQNKKDISAKASQSDLDLATGKITDMESEIRINAEGITSSVKKNELSKELDKMDMYAPNMLKNTRTWRAWNANSPDKAYVLTETYQHCQIQEQTGVGGYLDDTLDGLVVGNTYTASVWGKSTSVAQQPVFKVETKSFVMTAKNEDNHFSSEWRRYSVKFVAEAESAKVGFTKLGAVSTDKTYFSGGKVEVGLVNTGWKDNENDSFARISSAESAIIQHADQIHSTVQKQEKFGEDLTSAKTSINQMSDSITLTSEKITEIEGSVSEAKASIKVNSDSILQKVEQTDVDKAIEGINLDNKNSVLNSDFTFDKEYWTGVNSGYAIEEIESKKYLKISRTGLSANLIASATSNKMAVEKGNRLMLGVDVIIEDLASYDVKTVFALDLYDINDIRLTFKEFNLSDFETNVSNGVRTRLNTSYTVNRDDVAKAAIRLTLYKNGSIAYTNISLQKGDIKSSEWTPAPEDSQKIQAALSTSIEQNAKQIKLKAEASEVDRISGDLKDNQAALVITNDRITAQVTELERINDTVVKNESAISATARELSSKMTKIQVDSLIEGKGYATTSELQQTAEGFRTTVTDIGEEFAKAKKNYIWIAYADTLTGVGISKTDSNKAYLGTAFNKETEEGTLNPLDYNWTKVKGDTGERGVQGVKGADGADGKTTYTWIRYADTPTTGMSTVPNGKEYIGIAVNKNTITSSNTYADYEWSKIKGEQGVKGVNGTDGKPKYTWIRYANDESGTGISNDATGKMFIGFAYNKDSSLETDNPKDYQWSPMYDLEALDGISLKDKTEVLQGTEIFTDKSDNAVVHVDVDGISWQNGEPTAEKPVAVESLNNFEIVSSNGDSHKYRGKLKSANLNPFYLENQELVWAEIERLGLNTVTLPILVSFANVQTENMTIDPHSKTKALSMLEYLRTKDDTLNIIVEPYPLVDNGNGSETDINPANINNFFYNWGLVLNEIVEITKNFDIYGMYIASNLVHLEYAEGYWKNLITSLRSKFDGKVIYRKNWWTTASWAPETIDSYNSSLNNLLFSYVDIIAISAYFELNEDPVGSVQDVMGDLKSTRIFGRGQNIYQEIKNFADKWGKPVFFGELGFPNREKAGMAPWNPEVSAKVSDLAQINLFKAYGMTFNDEPWFLGSSIFQIGSSEVSSYKPSAQAGEIIQSWFSANADEKTSKVEISLPQPLRSLDNLKDVLFRDNDGLWKVKRYIGEGMMSGSETWTLESRFTTDEMVQMYCRIPSWDKIVRGGVLGKSNRFLDIGGQAVADGNGKMGIYTHNGYSVMRFKVPPTLFGRTMADSNAEIINSWNTWLKANETWVQYELATPTTEVLTQDLQTKLNNIQSFKGSNYVYTLHAKTDLFSPNLNATFKSSGWYDKFKVTTSVSILDEALEDGLLNKSEKEALRQSLNMLKSEKYKLDGEYAALKTSKLYKDTGNALLNSKSAYDTSYSNLIIAINNVLKVDPDKEIPQLLTSDVQTKFDAYTDKLNDLTKRLKNETFSQVNQTKDEIDLRVTKNGVVNAVNVSTEGVKIKGEKLEIDGKTTFKNDIIMNAGVIKSADGGTSLDLNKNEFNFSKPITFNYKPVATSQEVLDKINNINIGGRNLVIAKDLTVGYLEKTGATNPSTTWRTTGFIPVSVGEEYIASGYANLGTAPSTCFYNSSKVYTSGISNDNSGGAPDRDKRRLVKVPTGTSFMKFSFELKDIETVKLERGNKASDWTPAPEDVVADIEAAKGLANAAQGTANAATNSANTANNLLTDIANDSKLTALEKKAAKKEWDVIVSEKSKIDSSANKFGVSKTAYGTAYNSLNTYITPLLSNLNTTSTIVGTTFRSTFKAYYDARQDLLNAISDKSKTLAEKAQSDIDGLEIGGRNLLENSDFSKIYTGNTFTVGGKSYNEYPSGWGGYNGGISNPTTSYHAHIDKDTFGFNVVEYNESNGENNWKGISKNISGDLIEGAASFVVSADINTTAVGSKIFGGFHYVKKGNPARGFHAGQFTITPNEVNKWVRLQAIVPYPDNIDFSVAPSFYIYGYGFSSKSILYMKNAKLEKGNRASDWTPAPEDIQLDMSEYLDEKADKDAFEQALEDLAIAKSLAEDALNSDTYAEFVKGYDLYRDSIESDRATAERTLQDIRSTVSSIVNDMGTSSEKWKFIDTSITNSKGGIEISNEKSSMSVLIGADRISFFDNTVEVAFITGKVLQINHGIFVQSAQIGAHLISSLPENPDITVIQWVGLG